MFIPPYHCLCCALLVVLMPLSARARKSTLQMFLVPQQSCDLRIADLFTKKCARVLIFLPYQTAYLLNPAREVAPNLRAIYGITGKY